MDIQRGAWDVKQGGANSHIRNFAIIMKPAGPDLNRSLARLPKDRNDFVLLEIESPNGLLVWDSLRGWMDRAMIYQDQQRHPLYIIHLPLLPHRLRHQHRCRNLIKIRHRVPANDQMKANCHQDLEPEFKALM